MFGAWNCCLLVYQMLIACWMYGQGVWLDNVCDKSRDVNFLKIWYNEHILTSSKLKYLDMCSTLYLWHLALLISIKKNSANPPKCPNIAKNKQIFTNTHLIHNCHMRHYFHSSLLLCLFLKNWKRKLFPFTQVYKHTIWVGDIFFDTLFLYFLNDTWETKVLAF